MPLTGKNIVLGVTGGIAAYKTPYLVRALKAKGANVRVVMTQAAQAFVTPTTLQAVSGYPVHTDLFDPAQEAAMGHIELARWADWVLIAPATAQCLAKLAHGMADDLLHTLCLASRAPKVIAPAMNLVMWENEATQANIALLKNRDFQVLPVDEGEQACGEIGPGRMIEPDEIIQYLIGATTPGLLQGKRILMTAGPTHEPFDPVRFISNPSTGKMGYALAQAAMEMGADVTLVSGPTNLHAAPGIQVFDVTSAQEMHDTVMLHIKDQDIFIATAAVSDYRPKDVAAHKVKKSDKTLSIELLPNPDILKAVGSLKHRPYCVGFAAETENHEENAKAKLHKKQCDLICLNDISDGYIGFGSENNAITVYSSNNAWHYDRQPKLILSRSLLTLIAQQMERKYAHDLLHSREPETHL